MAMSSTRAVLPNFGALAWLHRFERSQGLRLGDSAGYPLPPPVQALPVRLEQHFGFASEPRAIWTDDQAGTTPLLQSSDFGVFAPVGVMPEHFTESVLHAQAGRPMRCLITDLTQRLAHLHYRSWSQLRPECESGRADNRFAQMLVALGGSDKSGTPHLCGHRPSLTLLPTLAASMFDVSVQVRCNAVSKVPHDNGFRLGCGSLNQAQLGSHGEAFGYGMTSLNVQLRTTSQLPTWRNTQHPTRLRFEQLVRHCTPVKSELDVRLQPPIDIPPIRLGCFGLGRSCLHPKKITQ